MHEDGGRIRSRCFFRKHDDYDCDLRNPMKIPLECPTIVLLCLSSWDIRKKKKRKQTCTSPKSNMEGISLNYKLGNWNCGIGMGYLDKNLHAEMPFPQLKCALGEPCRRAMAGEPQRRWWWWSNGDRKKMLGIKSVTTVQIRDIMNLELDFCSCACLRCGNVPQILYKWLSISTYMNYILWYIYINCMIFYPQRRHNLEPLFSVFFSHHLPSKPAAPCCHPSLIFTCLRWRFVAGNAFEGRRKCVWSVGSWMSFKKKHEKNTSWP